ncbi:MAG: glutaredoxin family protein [Actinomycetota bacterium]|nr:glutaredoxin family protein [Actinomycetota bacterium]
MRDGCHLCDDARPLVEWAATRSGVRLTEVDIDTDNALVGLYGMRIPVVLGPNGEVLAEGIIQDKKALREAIRSSLKV